MTLNSEGSGQTDEVWRLVRDSPDPSEWVCKATAVIVSDLSSG
jgi:hypothetical protein